MVRVQGEVDFEDLELAQGGRLLERQSQTPRPLRDRRRLARAEEERQQGSAESCVLDHCVSCVTRLEEAAAPAAPGDWRLTRLHEASDPEGNGEQEPAPAEKGHERHESGEF